MRLVGPNCMGVVNTDPDVDLNATFATIVPEEYRGPYMANPIASILTEVRHTVLDPTAPPRFFPEWGFLDSVSEFTGVEPASGGVSAMFNPYAAVRSMHVAFALMIGWSLDQLVRGRVARVCWWAYPVIVTYVIVATGNHFLMDAVLGAATAGMSALTARELARARPAVWRFGTRAAVSS